MAYIGIQPAESFTSFATQTFSVSATTSYTLDHAVANENEIALFVNNVRQQPGSGKAYTASGTALTLSAATATTDTMYCIFLGRALQTVTPATNSIKPAMLSLDDGVTITTDDNSDNLTLISTDTDANYGPNIEMSRPVTGADDDKLGRIDFSGQDDAGNTHNYASIEAIIADASSGSEDGRFMIRTEVAGSTVNMFDMNGTEVVINQDSVDYDFRVESNGQTHGLFLEGSTGNTYIGTSSGSIGNVGIKMFGTDDGTNDSGMNIVTAGSNNPISINRSDSDGTLIQFKQANSEEGTIAVSGSTVSYNTFTGTHWTRLADNSKPTILKGTVMESLDTMCDWYNLEFQVTEGEKTFTEKTPHVLTNSQSVGDKVTHNHNGKDYEATITKEVDIKHVQTKISTTDEAKNVYGVFHAWDVEAYNDMMVAAVGTYVVRIHKDETVAKGDLLQSNGDGTAKKQSDDNIKSSTFAKVLSNTKIETYSDGSYIVPCSLMC